MMHTHKSRRSWKIAIALLLAGGLAWSGMLDRASETYVDGALLGAGAVYATARGINALVSVLQGTELDLAIVSLSVGELLDPINDLIERFSALLLLAMGSLALQKILLELVSHTTFNLLLTLSALATLAAVHWGNASSYRFLLRFFIVTIALRFSLALVVVLSGWVDLVFLQQNEADRHAAVLEFKGKLNAITARAGLESDASEDRQELIDRLQTNRNAQQAELAGLRKLRQQLHHAETQLAQIDTRSAWDRLTGDTTIAIEGKKAEINRLEEQIGGAEYSLAALRQSAKAMQDKVACMAGGQSAEQCSGAGWWSKARGTLDIRPQILALEQQMDQFAANLINLLMSLILKCILLPLAFFYLLLRGLRFGRD